MHDVDDDALKSPFQRRGVRILLTALAVNALLALLLVGGPWLRGRQRAMEARQAFAEFAACVWGGDPSARPGLGLPEGEVLRYAHRVLHASDDWPERCRSSLRRVTQDPAWVLYPTIKQAEKVVADAVVYVDEGITDLARERTSEPMRRVPMDLHRRVERLLAALSNLAAESGTDRRLTAPAITFDDASLPVVTPTRVPLKVSRRASPRMWAHGDGLVTCAMDRLAIAYAKVGAGGMSLQRVRRPSLVQGTIPGPEGSPWLVWAMPDDRCAEDGAACAGRASGVAPLQRHHARAPDPLWLAAHPDGPIEHTVRVHAAKGSGETVAVDILARRPEGGMEVRRFLVGPAEGAEDPDDATRDEAAQDVERESASDPDGAPVAPRDPDATWSLPNHGIGGAARWVPSVDPAVHVTAEDEGASLWIRPLHDGPGAAPARVAHAPMDGMGEPPWLRACPYRKGAWVLYGRGAKASLARLTAEGQARAVDDPLPANARPDRLSLACNEAGVTIVQPEEDTPRIAWWRCDADGCDALPPIAARARHVQAIREGDTTVVAFAEGRNAQVRVVVMNDGATAPTPPQAVAPCFGDDGGHCGRPVLTARNGRILVGARDGSDLLVVETVDGGRTWLPMRGLR